MTRLLVPSKSRACAWSPSAPTHLERGQLRTLVDNLKQKLGEGVVVLASAQPEGKVAIIAGVTPGLIKRIQAGKLVGAVAKLVGGSGGGKPEIAEAGGKDQSQIDAALQAAPGIVGRVAGVIVGLPPLAQKTKTRQGWGTQRVICSSEGCLSWH